VVLLVNCQLSSGADTHQEGRPASLHPKFSRCRLAAHLDEVVGLNNVLAKIGILAQKPTHEKDMIAPAISQSFRLA
jgi:hypothetical protein